MNRPHIEGTPATKAVCERVAELNDGVCLLWFSRGKDAVAAWLYARQFFKRIVPIYFSPIPHLPIAERSLKYYEEYFETPIIRLVEGDAHTDLASLLLQPPQNEETIDNLKLKLFTREEATEVIREYYNLQGVYAAEGVGYYDSMGKRNHYKSVHGIDNIRRLFSPIYDWRKETLWKALETAKIKLSPDYKFTNRTFSGGPIYRNVANMAKMSPKDYERVKIFYPLVDGILARNEFRIEQMERQKANQSLN